MNAILFMQLFCIALFVFGGFMVLNMMWPEIKNILGFGESENPYKWHIVKVTNNGGYVCYKLDGYCYSVTHRSYYGKWSEPSSNNYHYHWIGGKFDKLEHCQAFHDYLKKEWDKKQLEKVKKVEMVK